MCLTIFVIKPVINTGRIPNSIDNVDRKKKRPWNCLFDMFSIISKLALLKFDMLLGIKFGRHIHRYKLFIFELAVIQICLQAK